MANKSRKKPLSQKLLNRIGHFVVEWSFAEMAANELLVRMVDIDWHDAIPFIYGIDLRPKLEALAKLSERRYFPPTKRQKLNSAIANLRSLLEDRNWIIHGYWLLQMPSGEATAMSYRKFDPVSMSALAYSIIPEKIDALIGKVQSARRVLASIDAKIVEQRRASRGNETRMA